MEDGNKLLEKIVGTEWRGLVKGGAFGGTSPYVSILKRFDMFKCLIVFLHHGNGLLFSPVAKQPYICIRTLVKNGLNGERRAAA